MLNLFENKRSMRKKTSIFPQGHTERKAGYYGKAGSWSRNVFFEK